MMRKLALSISVIGLLCSCTDGGLQPIEDQPNTLVDDLLEVGGTVCTSDPTEAVFPVKIMLIVDVSGSMQFTDPSSGGAPGRQAAARKLVDHFKFNPAVSFSLISFNGTVTVNGNANSSKAGFTRNTADIEAGLNSFSKADIKTDYQAALSTAYEILQRDMIESSPVDRIRTKYVVIFFSDGQPDPQCKAGCGNDEAVEALPGITVDSWCDVPRDQWCANFNQKVVLDEEHCKNMTTWFPAMVEPCKEYNSPAQLTQMVRQIMDLGQEYSVGEIRLHTALLFVDGLAQDVKDIFALDRAKSEPLLQDMAKAGNGFYRFFNSGGKIDFLSINYSTISRPFGMTNFVVSNLNALPSFNKLLKDSDGDGLDDELEFNAKTDCPIGSKGMGDCGLKETLVDSDEDGYNDKLEYDRRNAGFHPGDKTIPVRTCPVAERTDEDGDGLNACEEGVLGTDSKIADTDRDRIPDGLEFLWGTNPLVEDAKTDLDFDGKLSGEEIRIHSSPKIADTEVQANLRYIYDVTEQAERPDRKKCYDFRVRHVRLVTTLEKDVVGSLGFNTVLLYFGEGPSDDPRDYGDFWGACVRAQYVEPSYKNPADGKVKLTEEDFRPLSEIMTLLKTPAADPSQDPCKGATTR